MSNKILVIGIFVLLQLFNTLPAQTYEEWIQKSCDCIDKNDWMAAEEALKNAMREEPGNPANFALLCNLGTVQRRQGKKEEAVVSYTAALLAPTAINQQKFYFEYQLAEGGKVHKVKASRRFSIVGYTQMDLGIAKLHFEIGAGKDNFEWV